MLIQEAKYWQKLAGILVEQEEEEKISSIETINKDQAKQIIKNTRGKFFTVTFVKRMDGTIRVMNARLGVKAYLKGGTLPYNPEPKELIPVFDVAKRAYRMINLRAIINLKIGNKEYNIK
jgi:hypothetical protein